MKEAKRRLNKIFNQTSKAEIRRREMEKRLSKETKPKTYKVEFNLYAPEAKRVCLAGDFNNWDVDQLLMKRDKKGTWKASFLLPPGRYEYRFRVDGVWQDDPNAHEWVGNPFGSQNSLRIVS
jgi:1,4-alpha-glucan branching enzyme